MAVELIAKKKLSTYNFKYLVKGQIPFHQFNPKKMPQKGHLITAETEGFEPSIPFRGIHTFQACSFNHSDKSPFKGVQK